MSGETPKDSNGVSKFPGGLFAQVNPTGVGDGSNLTIDTKILSVSDGSKVQVANFGQGHAGNLFIRATEVDVFEKSTPYYTTGIFAGVGFDSRQNVTLASGNGGSLTIETGRLNITNGGEVTADTFGVGNAGKLLIQATNSVEVVGSSANPNHGSSSLSANVAKGATGQGGDLIIETGQLIVQNRGQVSVSSRGTGSAGSLEVTARSIQLDDQGQITAQTISGNGGNITLTAQDLLLLRNGSLISTNAGTTSSGGNGGNITINAPVIVAFPSNNDITANAFSGTGGNVKITTSGLFGIAPLSRAELARRLNVTDSSQTDPSQLDPRKLPTSDITAISQQNPSLSGTVNINSPDVDPSRGLVKLPVNVTDPTTLIAQNPCQRGIASSFTITGRGGLPSNPNQILASDNVRVDLVKPASSTSNSPTTSVNLPSTTPTVKRLVPAQGWIFNDKGQVVLTAYDPTNTGSQRSWQAPASCAKR